jgi:outer membrane protein insertion porin family
MGREMSQLATTSGTWCRHTAVWPALLLGGTMLVSPSIAMAQDAAPATPAPVPATPAAALAPAAAPAQDTIRTIIVTGAQRLEAQTILSYVTMRVGQTYTQSLADTALKDLYATELFSDVQISNSAGNVTITVQENPVINRIVLEGNKRIKSDKITPEVKLAPRQIFTRSKVRADVARIIELYKRQGRFAATVEPKMVQLPQNRVDIIFEITEGPKSKVRQINILGNEKFDDGKLKSEFVTKETGLLRMFSSSTSYDPDRLAFDQQKLRQFYLTEGYADFRVVSAVAELTPDKRDFIITYVVEEGDRYKFGDVAVDSQIRDFDSAGMTAGLPMKTGDWYNAKSVEDTVEQLTETAGAFGYAFADVSPQFRRDRESLTMNVTFLINEAPRVYVERIDINGNTLTQDKVVRREFRIVEGDAFNSLAVKRSTARINSLGYFQENFEVDQQPGSAPDRIILEANVEEQATGELQLSAGFSSLENFILQGSIRQRNFRGRGQTMGVSVNYSRYSRSGTISFTEPNLWDKNISAGIDVYRRDYRNWNYASGERNTTFQQSTTGFQLRAGVPLTEYMSVIARYTLNYDDVTLDESLYFGDFDGDGTRTCEPLLAGRYLCEAIGQRLSSILGLSLVYRDLDNFARPTRGKTGTINVDFAGLGGEVRYVRARFNAAQYWNLGSNFIFSITGEGGYIKGLGQDVRLTDRFFLGEPQLRGFDIRGVGPRVIRQPIVADEDGNAMVVTDRNRVTDDALGGNAYYNARAEIEIPLGSGARELGLRPSVFVDAGAVFDVKTPTLQGGLDTFPEGIFIATRDDDGNALYVDYNDPNIGSDDILTTSPIGPDNIANTPLGRSISPFQEIFVGNTPKPRVSVGFGVNWNSPFGPFRIDVAKALVKAEGDDTKLITFNVGTQF